MGIQNLESLIPALDELARAIEWCSEDIDDIPFKVVPVIQSQGKKARCAGWFSKDQWSTREGEMVAELNVTAELLNRDPVDIIATIRHEIVHVWQDFLGLKGVSTGGRHNKVFAEYAEILGLDVLRPAVDSYGLGYTDPSPELRERIVKEFQPDYESFNLFRLIKLKPKSDVKTNAYWCACKGMTLRIPAKQTLKGRCHTCFVTFVKKEDGDERPEWLSDTEFATRRLEYFVEELPASAGNEEIGDGEHEGSAEAEVPTKLPDVPEVAATDVGQDASAVQPGAADADVERVPAAPRKGRGKKATA